MNLIQVNQQNSSLKAEVAQLKSSKKELLNELKLWKEKYSSLSQNFKKSCSKADLLMDQLEKTKSNFENLPFLKKYKVLLCTNIEIKIVWKQDRWNKAIMIS